MSFPRKPERGCRAAVRTFSFYISPFCLSANHAAGIVDLGCRSRKRDTFQTVVKDGTWKSDLHLKHLPRVLGINLTIVIVDLVAIPAPADAVIAMIAFKSDP